MSAVHDRASTSLVGLDVFVGGPIQHAIRDDGFWPPLHDWIQLAISTLSAHEAHIFSAHVVEEFGDRTAEYTPDQVTARDLRWMSKCDVFVPILPLDMDGKLLRTDGTHIELGWATALGRPVVLLTTSPVVESASHLVKGLSTIADVQLLDLDSFAAAPELLVGHVLTATSRRREAAAGPRGRAAV
ncbi:nucleoside 2-deoxyribosyltransferase [Pseudonocardia sp. ICBG162]|uniref:nucleoside 2-deoxyribosyltransferase n=1 Tax=Pseudonocardia sp. ICBG162 TaxID=2846761 RepID=UPI001CF62050|nr:nucleoside 2-deoxyribosyltransferase [Pseudonocardia sp. ICBG162]